MATEDDSIAEARVARARAVRHYLRHVATDTQRRVIHELFTNDLFVDEVAAKLEMPREVVIQERDSFMELVRKHIG